MPRVEFTEDELRTTYDAIRKLAELAREGSGHVEWHLLGAASFVVHQALMEVMYPTPQNRGAVSPPKAFGEDRPT